MSIAKSILSLWKGSDDMSKQANQKYRKEMEFNHKERAKDSNPASDCTSNTVKDMPSREGYGDGNPDGSDCTDTKERQ